MPATKAASSNILSHQIDERCSLSRLLMSTSPVQCRFLPAVADYQKYRVKKLKKQSYN